MGVILTTILNMAHSVMSVKSIAAATTTSDKPYMPTVCLQSKYMSTCNLAHQPEQYFGAQEYAFEALITLHSSTQTLLPAPNYSCACEHVSEEENEEVIVATTTKVDLPKKPVYLYIALDDASENTTKNHKNVKKKEPGSGIHHDAGQTNDTERDIESDEHNDSWSDIEFSDELNQECVESVNDSKRKVRFDSNPEIHVMRTWDFAYRAARKSDWFYHAADNERFKRRVDSLAKSLDPFLTPEHRNKIFESRFAE